MAKVEKLEENTPYRFAAVVSVGYQTQADGRRFLVLQIDHPCNDGRVLIGLSEENTMATRNKSTIRAEIEGLILGSDCIDPVKTVVN